MNLRDVGVRGSAQGFSLLIVTALELFKGERNRKQNERWLCSVESWWGNNLAPLEAAIILRRDSGCYANII